MQCACAILSSVAFPPLKWVSILPHKRHDFRGEGGITEHKLFWFTLKLLSEVFFFILRINYTCSKTYTDVQILMKLEFLDKLSKNTLKYQISCKSVQWEPSCSMRTDKRTYRQTRQSYASKYSPSFVYTQNNYGALTCSKPSLFRTDAIPPQNTVKIKTNALNIQLSRKTSDVTQLE
jgi:hypothetical protein